MLSLLETMILTSEGTGVSRKGEHDVVRILRVDFDNLLESTIGESTNGVSDFVLNVNGMAL